MEDTLLMSIVECGRARVDGMGYAVTLINFALVPVD